MQASHDAEFLLVIIHQRVGISKSIDFGGETAVYFGIGSEGFFTEIWNQVVIDGTFVIPYHAFCHLVYENLAKLKFMNTIGKQKFQYISINRDP